ncbi:early nodulin-11-like [Beta vulgaris subsp. vulgaris]|uniref:early nodulin-11-like n=1 Tax=Beta vulgaris subsp. vulgaris TaxID=3555 RepID=UPI00254980D3|nr:early nodulin-11-like [Beta vulgaris subsp. vulgaris]
MARRKTTRRPLQKTAVATSSPPPSPDPPSPPSRDLTPPPSPPRDSPLTHSPEKTVTKNTPPSRQKTPVKPSPLKKTPVKKPPLKKPPVKRPPFKKPPVKTPPLKKTPAKKPPPKKPLNKKLGSSPVLDSGEEHVSTSNSAATSSGTAQTRKRKVSDKPSSSNPPPSKTKKTQVLHSSTSVKILSGRVFPMLWLKKPGFKFLSDALKSQGWLNLLNSMDGIYVDEVTQFYENLVVNESLVLTSTVNDIGITLSVDELAQLLGVPNSGFSDYTT